MRNKNRTVTAHKCAGLIPCVVFTRSYNGFGQLAELVNSLIMASANQPSLLISYGLFYRISSFNYIALIPYTANDVKTILRYYFTLMFCRAYHSRHIAGHSQDFSDDQSRTTILSCFRSKLNDMALLLWPNIPILLCLLWRG